LLPFVDGTDLFDANFIKKRNFIIKWTTYVHILHTVLLDCNATSTPKLISWLIVKMSTGVHVWWSIVYLCIYKSCLGLVATRSIYFADVSPQVRHSRSCKLNAKSPLDMQLPHWVTHVDIGIKDMGIIGYRRWPPGFQYGWTITILTVDYHSNHKIKPVVFILGEKVAKYQNMPCGVLQITHSPLHRHDDYRTSHIVYISSGEHVAKYEDLPYGWSLAKIANSKWHPGCFSMKTVHICIWSGFCKHGWILWNLAYRLV
jgi:hypothetical protein